jgi:hypothetical protein
MLVVAALIVCVFGGKAVQGVGVSRAASGVRAVPDGSSVD